MSSPLQEARIYLDNAATTPLAPCVLHAMLPYLHGAFHNPSSLTKPAQHVRQAITDARHAIAQAINAKPGEIFFTSGGTESINWAIKGAVNSGDHVITSAIEHHAVLETCKYLESRGCEVTYLPVDDVGRVSHDALAAAIRDNTRLVSISMANNEVGTVQPLDKIREITAAYGILLHTDAVQTVGHVPVNVAWLDVDMLSLSAHKFYGPKGVGALYIKKGTNIAPLLHGGAQEHNGRAGTENVVGIVGMAAALNRAIAELEQNQEKISGLRDMLIAQIFEKIPHTTLNGSPGNGRLPGNVNMCFKFVEGEAIMQNLDLQGFCVSTGSACASGSLAPSHVLVAMGLAQEEQNCCVRFTLGKSTTGDNITSLVAALVGIVGRLRDLSPMYDDFLAQRSK